jgi:hypothetical protein
MTEDIPYTHRFVADSDTGERMALAILGRLHRMKPQWIMYSCVLVLFTALLMSLMNASVTPRDRLAWGLLLALLPTLLSAVLGMAFHFRQVVRKSRARLYKGAILESGFGEQELVLRNPLASARLAYRGIQSVSARGDFVFLKFYGLSTVAVYPRELFPHEAISWIRLGQR